MSMGGTDRITTINILLNVSMSFLVGMFIFYMYKKTYQGVLYQRSFNISLVLASTVTALVIMTISGNLILSLGMVGALSIVRFRTPVKDSMDLIFLFWAISTGIANGVGYFNISIIGSILIAIFMLLLTRTGGTISDSFLMILQLNDPSSEEGLLNEIHQHADKVLIKSKSITDLGVELTLEVKIPNEKMDFINGLKQEHNIDRVTLVAYDQDMSAV